MGLGRVRSDFSSENFIYLVEIDLQLDSFMNYIKITEQVVEKEIKEQIIKYNESIKKLSDEELENSGDDYYFDNEIRINTNQLYFSSLFISLYSFLEKKLLQLCKLAEKNQNIKIRDFSGNGVVKYQNYLKKVIGIDFSKLNNEWMQISDYNNLRNLLVHSPGSELDNSDPKISKLKNIPGLDNYEREESTEFKFRDDTIVKNFLKIISKFLHDIYYVYE